jgi:hypothetical protein
MFFLWFLFLFVLYLLRSIIIAFFVPSLSIFPFFSFFFLPSVVTTYISIGSRRFVICLFFVMSRLVHWLYACMLYLIYKYFFFLFMFDISSVAYYHWLSLPLSHNDYIQFSTNYFCFSLLNFCYELV